MDSLIRWYTTQSFRPGILGWLLNPYYLVRTSLYRAIERNAGFLSGVMLDFGCGSKPYQHLFRVEKYVGLDVEQTGHPHRHEQIDILYDGRDIPAADQTFDSCFSSQVFEHVFDLPHSLSEIHRVLKNGGHCLFLVPFVWEEHEVPFDFARYSSFGFVHLLKKSGFEVVDRQVDSHYARVLAQLWLAYISSVLKTKNRYLNVLTNVVIVFPFLLVGWLLSVIAPRRYDLYFNNVVLAKKVSS